MPRLGGYKKKREHVRQVNPNFLKRERRQDSVVGEYDRLMALEAIKLVALAKEEEQIAEKARKEGERAHRVHVKTFEKPEALASEFTNALDKNSMDAQSAEKPGGMLNDSRNVGDENWTATYNRTSESDGATACTIGDEWLVSSNWNEAAQSSSIDEEFNSTAENEWTEISRRRRATHHASNAGKTQNDGGCFNCGGAHKKVDCPEAPKSGGTCHHCNEHGHFVKDCPQILNEGKGGSGRACYNCGEVGHFSKECPNESSGNSKPVTCYNCKVEGHRGRDCPEAPKSARHFTGTCYNCGGIGHQSRSCPDKATDLSSGSNSRFGNSKPKSSLHSLNHGEDFNSGFEVSEIGGENFDSAGDGFPQEEVLATHEAEAEDLW